MGLYGETSVDTGTGVVGLAFIVRFYYSLEVLFLMDGGDGEVRTKDGNYKVGCNSGVNLEMSFKKIEGWGCLTVVWNLQLK